MPPSGVIIMNRSHCRPQAPSDINVTFAASFAATFACMSQTLCRSMCHLLSETLVNHPSQSCKSEALTPPQTRPERSRARAGSARSAGSDGPCLRPVFCKTKFRARPTDRPTRPLGRAASARVCARGSARVGPRAGSAGRTADAPRLDAQTGTKLRKVRSVMYLYEMKVFFEQSGASFASGWMCDP
jgi:hypothetical protein